MIRRCVHEVRPGRAFDVESAVRSAGGEGVKAAAALAFGPSRPVTDPFDTVEFDAHKLDLRLKILDQDPEGEEHVMEIERVCSSPLSMLVRVRSWGTPSAYAGNTAATMSFGPSRRR